MHWNNSFILFPSSFLKYYFSISNWDQRLNNLFNEPKILNKTKQTKTPRTTLETEKFCTNILDQNVQFWQNLFLLFLLNLLPPQHLWINFRPTGISGWIIHWNVQALNLGWHSFPYSQIGLQKCWKMGDWLWSSRN